MVTHRPTIPADMREVTKEEFYALLKAAKRDIMPSARQPYFTTWETQEMRDVWGWSAPGWKNTGAFPMVYAVKREFGHV